MGRLHHVAASLSLILSLPIFGHGAFFPQSTIGIKNQSPISPTSSQSSSTTHPLPPRHSSIQSFRNAQLVVSNDFSNESSSTPTMNAPTELVRAFQIFSTITTNLLFPLGSSLLKELPSDTSSFSSWTNLLSQSQTAHHITNTIEKLGPTYVKFGQAAASRSDLLPSSLTTAFSKLQDRMQPFETEIAKDIIRSEFQNQTDIPYETTLQIVESLSGEPVAAASVGQVYKGYVEGYGDVAIKVKRPVIEEIVAADAKLLRTLAKLAESLPPAAVVTASTPNGNANNQRLIATELVRAVDEFFSRLYEELDYRREARNIETFGKLYGGGGRGSSRNGGTDGDGPNVVVPSVLSRYCTENVLVMEWIEGEKLVSSSEVFRTTTTTTTSSETETTSTTTSSRENLELLKLGIRCTLSQLFETGILHADPHGGNLLKVHSNTTTAEDNPPSLAYLDFGLVAEVPEQVRDGLVCAICQLVFNRDVDAMASLFAELQLLPQEVLDDPVEKAALTAALDSVVRSLLLFPNDDDEESSTTTTTTVPVLKFDQLLESLVPLIPRFRFQLPPYFLNNARALGTLEGMAKSIDPEFNVLQMVYPYALNRLFRNPSRSEVVERTLQSLVRSKITGDIEWMKVKRLVNELACMSGRGRFEVVKDVLNTKGGRRFWMGLVKEDLKKRLSWKEGWLRMWRMERRVGRKPRRLSKFLAL